MTGRKDILYDTATGDLTILNGDFRIGPSDLQHAEHIVRLPKGAWKQYPMTGVGEAKLKNAPLDAALRREIQIQLEADGYRMTLVRYNRLTNELDLRFDL